MDVVVGKPSSMFWHHVQLLSQFRLGGRNARRNRIWTCACTHQVSAISAVMALSSWTPLCTALTIAHVVTEEFDPCYSSIMHKGFVRVATAATYSSSSSKEEEETEKGEQKK